MRLHFDPTVVFFNVSRGTIEFNETIQTTMPNPNANSGSSHLCRLTGRFGTCYGAVHRGTGMLPVATILQSLHDWPRAPPVTVTSSKVTPSITDSGRPADTVCTPTKQHGQHMIPRSQRSQRNQPAEPGAAE